MTTPNTDTLAGLLADATPGPWGLQGYSLIEAANSMVASAFLEGAKDRQGRSNAQILALAPELAEETIALRAQAAKDKTKIERYAAALREIANCGQSAEPDHWKFRCMAREKARAALEDGGMTKHRTEIAALIKSMTFGDLIDLAVDLRDSIEISWRSYSDNEFTPLDLASALHSWAEGQDAEDGE